MSEPCKSLLDAMSWPLSFVNRLSALMPRGLTYGPISLSYNLTSLLNLCGHHKSVCFKPVCSGFCMAATSDQTLLPDRSAGRSPNIRLWILFDGGARRNAATVSQIESVMDQAKESQIAFSSPSLLYLMYFSLFFVKSVLTYLS